MAFADFFVAKFYQNGTLRWLTRFTGPNNALVGIADADINGDAVYLAEFLYGGHQVVDEAGILLL